MSLELHRETVIGELVAKKPQLSKIFERMDIDYYTGGQKTLLQVCREKGMDVQTLLFKLKTDIPNETSRSHNLYGARLDDITRHILMEHHQYLYEAMPRLAILVEKVVRVHGEHEPRLYELKETYHALCSELEVHMAKEEKILFPYCEQLGTGNAPSMFRGGSIENPIHKMAEGHEKTRSLLKHIRHLTNNYTPPDGSCASYHALLEGLSEMQADIHQHIHEENNILFPAAILQAKRKEQA